MVRMTYLGSLSVNGGFFLCSSLSANLETHPEFYDHVIGLKDDANAGSATKGVVSGQGGEDVIQKKIYRFVPKLPKGSFSGPAVMDKAGKVTTLLDAAKNGTSLEYINLAFFSGGLTVRNSVQLRQVVVSSFTLNAAAGDVMSFSCEVVGTTLDDFESDFYDDVPCSKLLTWDRLGLSVSAPWGFHASNGISSFSLSVSNPVTPIYTAGNNGTDIDTGLFPRILRIGTQQVSGSIGSYDFNGKELGGDGVISMSIDGQPYDLHVAFSPSTNNADGGKFISSTPFTGASDRPVWF
jgi:hypothetical protein